jgi:hypothetical protein
MCRLKEKNLPMQAGIEVGTVLLKSEIGVGYSILSQPRAIIEVPAL